jgi:quercetin dioxygenase-like cupin family protein
VLRCNALSITGGTIMLDTTVSKFSHVKPSDTDFIAEGLRDFFKYRDLGIAEATGGKVLAQLVRANLAPEKGTGWHRHEAEFHIVLMLKGWARFMYGDKETLVAAGDCVHQRPGIVHYLFDYSPDMEYLEVVGPADFSTVDVAGPCEVPAPKGWK